MWIAAEQLEVAGQLLHAVDVAAALDLDGDRRAVGIAHQQVDRPDRRRVLAAHERRTLGDALDLLREKSLKVCLDAVLLQSGIDAQLVRGVMDDLVDLHAQRVTGLLVGDPPDLDDAGARLFLTRSLVRERTRGLIQFSGL